MGVHQSLVHLLHLASPALPIGAYSYSQGLEWAVEAGDVRDADSAQRWIGDVLANIQARGEIPVLLRLYDAVAAGDGVAFSTWNAWLRASRETAELAAETQQMGAALAKLLVDLEVLDDDARSTLAACAPVTLPGAFAIAARAFAVAREDAAIAYLWSWLENQVLAAVKIVPLGQVAGQRMLLALGSTLPNAVARAQAMPDADVASFAPGLALASARHETQYTRLFRS